MTTTTLLPCPFCKSNELRIRKLPKIDKDFQDFKMYESCVECLNCGADGPKIAYVDDVITAWNTRKFED